MAEIPHAANMRETAETYLNSVIVFLNIDHNITKTLHFINVS